MLFNALLKQEIGMFSVPKKGFPPSLVKALILFPSYTSGFFDTIKTGEISSRLNTDTSKVKGYRAYL